MNLKEKTLQRLKGCTTFWGSDMHTEKEDRNFYMDVLDIIEDEKLALSRFHRANNALIKEKRANDELVKTLNKERAELRDSKITIDNLDIYLVSKIHDYRKPYINEISKLNSKVAKLEKDNDSLTIDEIHDVLLKIRKSPYVCTLYEIEVEFNKAVGRKSK